MKLHFLGAARVVTGSCYLLDFGKSKVLVDCGMFQGRDNALNFRDLPFNPKQIDAILLTHAHLDHCGMIPKVVRGGFNGPIYCTAPTADLAKIVLEDSAHLQEFETKYDNRRLSKEGKPLRKPLYKPVDAKKTFKLFKQIEYNQTYDILPGLKAVYRDAGHILGSAHIEVFVGGKKIVFSGDIGQWDSPIVNNPTLIKHADYVICESTYGGRTHERVKERNKLLYKAIQDVAKRDGKLLIPSFAIERTQELLFALHKCADDNCIDDVPVFVDSPMASKATKVFAKHTQNYDEETRDHIGHGDNPFTFPSLHTTESANDSKALNALVGPAVIIAGSGMCTGGRIKHHIKHHMPNKDTMMLFVGYQAYGSLGRRIQEGQKSVRIYGDHVKMNGEIRTIQGFSGHADEPQLLKWLKGFEGSPKVFFTHGEYESAQALKRAFGSGHIPKMLEKIDL